MPYHAAKFEKILRVYPEKFCKAEKITDLQTQTQKETNQQQVFQLKNYKIFLKNILGG